MKGSPTSQGFPPQQTWDRWLLYIWCRCWKVLLDTDRNRFCSQQTRNDSKTKAMSHVGENDHGHRYEIQLSRHVGRNQTVDAQFEKYSCYQIGEADDNCSGQEDAFPEVFVRFSSMLKLLMKGQIFTG